MGAAPAGPLLLQHLRGGLLEGRRPLDAAALGERVSALAGELAVGDGLLAGLGERDQGDAAEPEFVPPAADDEPLHPAPGAGGLDEQVESLSVAVSSWRGVADEGGRQSPVGMAAAGLSVSDGGVPHIMHHTPLYGGRRCAAQDVLTRQVDGSAAINGYYPVIYERIWTEPNDTGRHMMEDWAAYLDGHAAEPARR